MAADGIQQFGDVGKRRFLDVIQRFTVDGNAAGVRAWKPGGKITLEMMEWWENHPCETLLSALPRFTRHSLNGKTDEGGLLGKCRVCDGRCPENFGSGAEYPGVIRTAQNPRISIEKIRGRRDFRVSQSEWHMIESDK
jgi:hypothetical protein